MMVTMKDCIDLANKIITRKHIPLSLVRDKPDLSVSFYWAITEQVLNIKLTVLLRSFEPLTDESSIKILLETLSELLDASLDHIDPSLVVRGHARSSYDLLEVIHSFLDCLPFNQAEQQNEDLMEHRPTKHFSTSRSESQTIKQTQEPHQDLTPPPSHHHSRDDVCTCTAANDLILSPCSERACSCATYSINSDPSVNNQDKNDEECICECLCECLCSKEDPHASTNPKSFLSNAAHRTVKSSSTKQNTRPKESTTTQKENSDLKELERLYGHNFALEIGNKLKETLELKKKVDEIEHHFRRIDLLQHNPSKLLAAQKKSLSSRKTSDTSKMKSNKVKLIRSKSQEKIIDQLIKESERELFEHSTLPKVTQNLLTRRQKEVELLREKRLSELDRREKQAQQAIREAIEVERRRQALLSYVDPSSSLAARREVRTKRAVLKKSVDDYHLGLRARLAELDSLRDKQDIEIVSSGLRQEKDALHEQIGRKREEMAVRERKDRNIQDSVKCLYQNARDEAVDEIERRKESMQARLADQIHLLKLFRKVS